MLRSGSGATAGIPGWVVRGGGPAEGPTGMEGTGGMGGMTMAGSLTGACEPRSGSVADKLARASRSA